MATQTIPAYVSQAILSYQPLDGFTVVPKRRGERSLILDWGVRISCMLDGREIIGWICQGSRSCQRMNKIFQLHGNTSKATKHLADAHKESSSKTIAETGRKRSRQEEIARIMDAITNTDDCRRMALLIETLRIVRNNLPFRLGEYDESELLADLAVKDEFRATVNRQTVSRAIVELYDFSKRAVRDYLARNRVDGVPSLAMVTDFWSCKTQPGTKYLGLRVYLVDSDWNYRSVLLGTRHFQPLYGERSGGYRTPFKRWILELLHDFGLELTDFYGSTTDSGPDVKWMMRTGLSLRWEWCMPHLTNAATKMAFGIVPQRSESKNLPLTDLISRILQIIYAIRSNEAMGSLFSELCALADPTGTTQLLSFKDHRFMGLTRVIRRILEKWEPLEQWFDERRAKAIRARKALPRDFPLADDKETLLQLLALLDPITTLNIRAQSESPNQVEVLLTLYRLRVTILDETMGLKDRLRGRDAAPLHYRVSELTPEVRSTRHLLAQAFHKNFFSRYTDRAKMRECSYIPEAQMCLHPVFKNPDRGLTKVVRLSSTQLLVDPKQPHLRLDEHTVQRNVDKVKECVRKCITSLMMSTAEAEAVSQERQTPTFLATTTSQWMMATTAPPVAYSEELTDLFGETPSQEGPRGGQEGRVEEELDRWLADTISLDQKADKTTETLLEFWHRQEETNNYHLLPRVARILFAIPSLSASIERDFGVSGMMVTAQRTSLAKHNIEMCSFLNRNSSFTQLTQCKPLMDEEYENAVPASMLVSLEPPPDEQQLSPQWEAQMAATLFGTNVDEECIEE